MKNQDIENTPIFTAIVMGVSGAGKSTLINAIFGRKVAIPGISSDKGVTETITLHSGNTTAITLLPKRNRPVDGYTENYSVKIYDVPGFDKDKFNADYFTKTIKEKELDPVFSNRPNVIIYCINPNIKFNAITNETQFINDIREFTKQETGRELPIVLAFTKTIMSKEDLSESKRVVADSINRDSDARNRYRDRQDQKTISLERITPDDIVETLAMPMDLIKEEDLSESSDDPAPKTTIPAYGVSQLVRRVHEKCEAGVECSRELYRKNKSTMIAAASAIPAIAASGAFATASMLIPGWNIAVIACAVAGGVTFLGGTGLVISKDALSKMTKWYRDNEDAANEYLEGLKQIDTSVAKLQNDIRTAKRKGDIQKSGDEREGYFKLSIQQCAPNNGIYSAPNTYKLSLCKKELVAPLIGDYGLNVTEEQIDNITHISVDKANYVSGDIFTDKLSSTYRQAIDELYIRDFNKKSPEQKNSMLCELKESVQSELNALCNSSYEEYCAQEQPQPVYDNSPKFQSNRYVEAANTNWSVQNGSANEFDPAAFQEWLNPTVNSQNSSQNMGNYGFGNATCSKWPDNANGSHQGNRQATDFDAMNSQFGSGHWQNNNYSQANSQSSAKSKNSSYNLTLM